MSEALVEFGGWYGLVVNYVGFNSKVGILFELVDIMFGDS